MNINNLPPVKEVKSNVIGTTFVDVSPMKYSEFDKWLEERMLEDSDNNESETL